MQHVPGYLNPILAESVGGLPENHKVLCHSEVAAVSLLEVRYERQQYEKLLWNGIPYN